MLPAVPLLLALIAPPGVIIDHHPSATRQYIGSPSIAIVPGGVYVASHDFFGPGSTQSTSAVTRVFRSTDRGRSWNKTAEFSDQFWSSLLFHRGKLYLMGTTFEYGRIVIRQSADGGLSWSQPFMLTQDAGYHTATVPFVEKDGRLWRGMEFHPPGRWGFFQAFVMSAPAASDLTDPVNWTMTERLPYPAAEAGEGQHWLEGNVVVDRDGSLLNVLRVANIEKAAITRVRNGRLEFEGLIDFPGGAKKFTIRYDRKSKRYWTLSNPALSEYPMSAKDPASVRNTLVLMSSKDLRHWKVERTVLSHPDPIKHAFQYVDWQFDGNDLVAASRTAFDDDQGGPPRGHDANYLTFHRIVKFRARR
ncbi:MAG: exo-alpha-sialidase [Acidobacteria bacterium]|nr:exo-alpha-sialidase [Acidobacteriota bacterium]